MEMYVYMQWPYTEAALGDWQFSWCYQSGPDAAAASILQQVKQKP